MRKFYLDTPRLTLRPFEDRDVETFARYRSDPDVARYQSWDTPFTIEQAAQFVAQLSTSEPGTPGEWYQIAIERNTSGEMIGDCAFQILMDDPQQAEIGFTLAPAQHRQGYATEAVLRLLQYLFEDLHLHRVRANCDPQNTASGRVLERVGMRHEGRFIESLWFKGCWSSEDWYAILRREWDTRQR